MEYVLRTDLLTKAYYKKIAVNQLSMNVHKGDIYGFIGKNGAGKTTLMKMVCGLVKPTSGKFELFEANNLKHSRKRCGLIIGQPALYPNMTVEENLKYYAYLIGMTDQNVVKNLLQGVGLYEAQHIKTKNLSLGMKQRLGIAIALIGSPDFLILDEPMSGLDPEGIKDIRRLLLKLNEENDITILISSHILGELYRIATRYGVIDNGTMIEEFTKEELDERCKQYIKLKVDDTKKASYILEEHIGIKKYEVLQNHVIHLYDLRHRSGKVNEVLVKNDVIVDAISLEGVDLEAYFMKLMGGRENA